MGRGFYTGEGGALAVTPLLPAVPPAGHANDARSLGRSVGLVVAQLRCNTLEDAMEPTNLTIETLEKGTE
jgi:hypothetical protein